MAITVFVDGGCHDNQTADKRNAYGSFSVMENDKVLWTVSEPYGNRTNNEAEYLAMLSALKGAIGMGYTDVIFYTDSQLMYNQVRGEYTVKAANLVDLCNEIRGILEHNPTFQMEWVPRDKIVKVLGH